MWTLFHATVEVRGHNTVKGHILLAVIPSAQGSIRMPSLCRVTWLHPALKINDISSPNLNCSPALPPPLRSHSVSMCAFYGSRCMCPLFLCPPPHPSPFSSHRSTCFRLPLLNCSSHINGHASSSLDFRAVDRRPVPECSPGVSVCSDGETRRLQL